MAKLFYKTQSTYKPGESSFEVISGKSETVPDDDRTVKQLMARFAAGSIPGEQNAVYLDTGSLDKINKYYTKGGLDLTEIADLKEINRRAEAQFEAARVKKEEEKKAADLDKKVEEEIAKREAEKAKSQDDGGD